jgi:hypothetical protein
VKIRRWCGNIDPGSQVNDLPTCLAQHPATLDAGTILISLSFVVALIAIAGGGYWLARRAKRKSPSLDGSPADIVLPKQRSAYWPLGLKIGGGLGAVLGFAGEWALDDRWNVLKLLLAAVVACIHGQWIGAATALAIRAFPRKRWDLIGLVSGGIIGAGWAAFADRSPGGDLGPYLLVSVTVAALIGGVTGLVVALIRWLRGPRL